MAKNLQAKLAPSDALRLFDINTDAMARLAEDMRSSRAGGAAVETATSVADAARDAVGGFLSSTPPELALLGSDICLTEDRTITLVNLLPHLVSPKLHLSLGGTS